MKYSTSALIPFVASLLACSQGFTLHHAPTKRSVMSMKRGRGSINEFRENASSSSTTTSKTGGNGLGKAAAAATAASASAPKSNWTPVQGIKSIKDLPTEEGKVKLFETMANPFMNAQTNPNGAIAVVKYGKATYCMGVNCSACQIPLNKAEILEPNEETDKDPRLACTFCRATFNLKTGERVNSAESGGLMGGIMSGLFSKSDEKPQPVYALGEKNGQVYINTASSS